MPQLNVTPGLAVAIHQVGEFGVVTVRVHETATLKALVVTDAGQQYPAP